MKTKGILNPRGAGSISCPAAQQDVVVSYGETTFEISDLLPPNCAILSVWRP